jgi:hypothetical protein
MNYQDLRDNIGKMHEPADVTDQEVLLRHLKHEMDRAREAFSRQMTSHFFGAGPGPNWTPPVYTRRQRISWWLRSTINSTRERIALWFAPWLEERDD